MIGGQINQICRQPHLFSQSQLASIALMLDEEEKNLARSDKKKRM
jgi:hypothetical protein